MIFGLEQEGGSLIALMALAHPLHPIHNRSRNKRRNLWVGRCVSSWWPWFPSRSSVLITYICMCIPYMSSVTGRIYIYIYIYIYNGSVIQYWRSFTPSRSIGLYFWGVRGSWAEYHFLFSLVYQLCLALWYESNTRMLVTFGIYFKQHFNTRYLVFYNLSPPRMSCPWTFFENIGFNMVLKDPFMSHLATQLGYSAGEFQALQQIVLAAFGVVD